MLRWNLRYRLLVVTVLALAVWGAAVNLPYTFQAGDVISAEAMNESLQALDAGKQERVTGTCDSGSAIRVIGEDGSVTCQSVGAVTGDDGHDHFGQAWEGEGTNGLTIVNTAVDQGGPTAVTGRVGAAGPGVGLNAIGVWGEAPSGAGVAGSSALGFGVYGTSPQNRGVFGESDSGTGVFGYSPNGYGLQGSSDASIAIIGRAPQRAIVGVLGNGSCAGVYGVGGCAVDGDGVMGNSQNGRGVFGQSGAGTGVYGYSPNGFGVQGASDAGIAVIGRASQRAIVGVLGNGSCPGVYGVGGCAGDGDGVTGRSSSGRGVFGTSVSGFAAAFVGGSGGGGTCSYSGGAGWNCTSDQNAKENFTAVDPSWVLEQLSDMPVTTWTMKGDANEALHMGPTAQDFRSAFGLGDDDVTINTADAQGVALAAIQALYLRVLEQEEKIATLESDIAALRQP